MKIKNGWIITLVLFLGYFSVTSMMEHQARQADHNHDQLQLLRKISEKICILEGRFDDTPWKESSYNRIQERGDEAEFLIRINLEQLRLFKTGKVRTGIKALFIPVFFLNDEERAFDKCNDLILSYYDRVHYYTAEMSSLLKDTLSERQSSIIERRAKWAIKMNISAMIEKVIAEEVVFRNDGEVPRNIGYEIGKYDISNSESGKELEEQLLNHILTKIDQFDFNDVKQMIIKMSMPSYQSPPFKIISGGLKPEYLMTEEKQKRV